MILFLQDEKNFAKNHTLKFKFVANLPANLLAVHSTFISLVLCVRMSAEFCSNRANLLHILIIWAVDHETYKFENRDRFSKLNSVNS